MMRAVPSAVESSARTGLRTGGADDDHRDDEGELGDDPRVAEQPPRRAEAEGGPGEQREEAQRDAEAQGEGAEEVVGGIDERRVVGRGPADGDGEEAGRVAEQADRHDDVHGEHEVAGPSSEAACAVRGGSAGRHDGPGPPGAPAVPAMKLKWIPASSQSPWSFTVIRVMRAAAGIGRPAVP